MSSGVVGVKLRSQDRRHQSGLSLVSILGILLLLIVMAGMVYLFLPVDETELVKPSQTTHFPDEKTPKTEFSSAELQQLQPIDDAEPELKRIAQEIAEQQVARDITGNQNNPENNQSASDVTPSSSQSVQAAGQSVKQSLSNTELAGAITRGATDVAPRASSSGTQSTLSAQRVGGGDLAGSDGKVRDSIIAIDPSQTMISWLVGEELIRHFVVLVDNIANGAIPSKQMVFKSPKGSLVVQELGEDYVLLAKNYSRYQSYTQLLSTLPPETVVRYYQQFYPLLQQAYMELGYPKSSFHHRLLDAIEVVLNAPMPDPGQELILKRSSVMFTYADESLQAGSDVNKLLLRMGPENAGLFKESLWQWKRLLIQLDHR